MRSTEQLHGSPLAQRTAQVASYVLVQLLVLLLSKSASAQSCAPNMLSISGEDSYVTVADNPLLQLRSGLTIECWAKLDGVNKQSALIDKGSGSTSYYGLYVDSGKIVGRLQQTTGLRLSYVIPNPGDWHHYALVFYPGDSAYLYLDGVEVVSQKVSSSLLSFGTDSLRIGASAAGTSFIGDIDEVRLWNTPLSASSINSRLSTSLKGDESGLAAYYPIDDDPSSSRIHDFSNHKLDGFLQGISIEIGPSSSPVTQSTPGYRLDVIEKALDLGRRRCNPSFDTVIHVRNLGTQSLLVNSVAPFRGQAFSVTTDIPFILPADSTKSVAIKIHFSATGGGVYNDSLYISSTDNCAGTVRIGLHAIYDSVGVLVNPSILSIGSVLQCEYPVSTSASIRNISTTDSVTIVSAPAVAGVSLTTPLPIRLAPGELRNVSFRVDSAARGFVNASLSLMLDKCSRLAALTIQGFRTRAEFGVPGTIDFGTTGAQLGGVAKDTVIVVTNTGDRGMQILGFGTSDTSLRVTEQRAPLFLAVGDTMQVHLRFTARQCGLNETKLHIRGFYCSFDTVVTVRMTLTSPEQLLANTLQTGVTCNFLDTTLLIVNPNDRSMKIESITYDQDAIFFVRPFTFPLTIAPHDSARVDIRFNPGTNGDYNVTGFIAAEPCSITPVRLLGSKGINGVTFAANPLDFGRGCKADPVTQTVTLRNLSPRVVTITDTLYFGSSRFSVDPIRLPLTIGPGARTTFTVHYAPTLGVLDTGRFSLIAREGCLAADLRIRGSRETPRVATIEQSVAFDTVCSGQSEVRVIHVQNAGIDSVDLGAITVGAPYAIVRAPRVIASGKTDSILVRFSPIAAQTALSSVRIPFATCGDTLQVNVEGSGGPLPSLIASVDTLDFGTVNVNDSAVRCFTLSNASCTPLFVNGGDCKIDDSSFHLSAAPQSDTVSRGRSTFICLTFAPRSRDTVLSRLYVFDNTGDSVQVILRGTGVTPAISLNPKTLDFGSVLHGAYRDLSSYLVNTGNATAHFTLSTTAPEFQISGPDSLTPGSADSIHVRFTPGTSTSQITALGLISYDELQDTLQLMGIGSDRGLQISSLESDFGDVHVDRDSVTRIALTAVEDPATIESISGIPPTSSFSITDTVSSFPHVVKVGDTVWLDITYRPTVEQSDAATVAILTDKGQSSIALRGAGVSEHIAVNATAIDIGDVELGNSETVPKITLTNTGSYPLTLLGATTRIFAISPSLNGVEIPPGGLMTLDITFAPTRARRYVDTLAILSSAPEGPRFVLLTGRGVYPIATRPKFSYVVGSVDLRSGDQVNIPVSIAGSFIDHLDADSTVLQLSFDPTMMRVRGVTSSSLRSWEVNSDSELTVILNGVPNIESKLFDLRAEALLGTHRSSLVRVTYADPSADNSPLGVDGVFTVTDCDGGLHGVGFKGDYTLKQSVPNPATGTVRIEYALGLPGRASIDFFNAIGQHIQSLDLGEQTAGTHHITVDLSSLPAGRYTYRLQSLEYHADGTLLIVK